MLSASLYNQMFTMHATTMIFLFVMPMAAAWANYFVPLQIGARDVAFPRLNAFGFWCFLFGGIFLNTSWFLGGAADGGWFMYQPNANALFSPTHGVDFWSLGLQITGIASLTGALNLIVTILNMRAPGMNLMKMPIFTWMILVAQFLLVFAIPVITVALFLLMFQRVFGAQFFNVDAGADPLLWQHLFWIFGHPEVYILILPSFGIVSEVLPVFSRKPLFGYKFVVFSGAAIGFLGWGVWAHHMFASGLGPVSVAVFSVSTMLIAIPTGVKIVNWTLTMWGGKIHFTTAMLFAIGLIVEFTIGGSVGRDPRGSPERHAADRHLLHRRPLPLRAVRRCGVRHLRRLLLLVAEDVRQDAQRDARQVELLAHGHRHEPHVRADAHPRPAGSAAPNGRVPGQAHRRRVLQPATSGTPPPPWARISSPSASSCSWSTCGDTTRKGVQAPLDPWDARSLEWLTTSPPKVHNFDVIPHVHSLDEYFHLKYEEVDTDTGPRLVKVRSRRRAARRPRGQCRQAHPHAVAVVLADARGRRVADHGLRHHLLPPADGRRRCDLVDGDVRVGARASPSPTTATTTRPPKVESPSRSLSVSEATLTETPADDQSGDDSAVAVRVDDDHVADDHGAGDHGGHMVTSTGLSNNKLAMWLFLGSECLLFGGLISTYMLYRGTAHRYARPRAAVGHPADVGVELRAADELAHHGARPSAPRSNATTG